MRKIIHIDLDAFFCAVEEGRNPALRGVPFAVGGRPESRGVVASCSYAARRYGIHSAMPMSQAVKRCPSLVIVPANHRIYDEVSQQVMAILHDLSERVEQISIDEAFLDVSARPESAPDLAAQLQARICRERGLPCSLGVATNKLVAKIATDVGKAAVHSGDYPNAIQIVPPGEERIFLDPLPTRALWGVGPKTAEKLAELGIHTIGDIARSAPGLLESRFGKNGRDLVIRAQGIDPREVETDCETKSISQETTFAVDVRDDAHLRRTVHEQAEEVGRRLRRERLAGVTIKLKLRWSDFTTLTRQTTLDHPTDRADEIGRVAEHLLAEHHPPGRDVRLIGVAVSGLGPSVRQMTLFDLPSPKEEKLDEIVRSLRKRFGDDAVRRGSELE
ncbi:MAG: DNA polymerase IV [Caldilineaceae bacterium]|nr:DNA polymerase IV [Caldilineaceae bacterium]